MFGPQKVKFVLSFSSYRCQEVSEELAELLADVLLPVVDEPHDFGQDQRQAGLKLLEPILDPVLESPQSLRAGRLGVVPDLGEQILDRPQSLGTLEQSGFLLQDLGLTHLLGLLQTLLPLNNQRLDLQVDLGLILSLLELHGLGLLSLERGLELDLGLFGLLPLGSGLGHGDELGLDGFGLLGSCCLHRVLRNLWEIVRIVDDFDDEGTGRTSGHLFSLLQLLDRDHEPVAARTRVGPGLLLWIPLEVFQFDFVVKH